MHLTFVKSNYSIKRKKTDKREHFPQYITPKEVHGILIHLFKFKCMMIPTPKK
ncbi:hypothetical protein Hanom_Chr04g00360301 [Helianthus anomalus]